MKEPSKNPACGNGANEPAPALRWDLASLVDLETILEWDQSQEATTLKQRDRAFYVHHCGDGAGGRSRSEAFRAWVEERRRELTQCSPTPGEEAASLLRWLAFSGFFVTFLFGAIVAWGALTVHGVPVNVLTFWLLLVGLPFLLTMAGFYLLLGCRFSHVPQPPLFLKRLLAKQLAFGVLRAGHLLTGRIGSEREALLRARAGELRSRFSDRHSLISSLLANTLHLFGFGMVLGIFAALFSFKNFSNQDYGWQSDAAYVNAGRVERFTSLVSLPWTSIFGRDAGRPTMVEIKHTRYLRNQERTELDHSSSINWSSFLVLSSLFWGVLPRAVLLLSGRVVSRRQLNTGDFNQHRFDALWRRMEKPSFTTVSESSRVPDELAAVAVATPDKPQLLLGSGLLVIPQELSSEKLGRNVADRLEAQYGLSSHEFRPLPPLPLLRALLLEELASLPGASRMDLHFLQESFMPPVREFSMFLKSCRKSLGRNASLRVVLVGERTGDGTWSVPSAQHRSVWENKIAAIGDPRLSVLSLDPSETIPV